MARQLLRRSWFGHRRGGRGRMLGWVLVVTALVWVTSGLHLHLAVALPSPTLRPHHRAADAGEASPKVRVMAARVVAYARAQLGKPYMWGADGPAAFDCSGLAGVAWRHAGLAWPDLTAAGQWRWLHDRGGDVDRAHLAPGDLVFYAWTPGDWRSIHHVGVYVGSGRMVEAPHRGALVRMASITRDGFFGAARPRAAALVNAGQALRLGGGGR